MTTTYDQVIDAVVRRPGMTERELAIFIFGDAGYQQRVNPACRSLRVSGKMLVEGKGGTGDPFRYFPR